MYHNVTAALFTTARTWKQPKCPSTDEWIKKMWHIYTMEYYSAIKRNQIELFVVRWMDLKSVIQSEVSQKEKNGELIEGFEQNCDDLNHLLKGLLYLLVGK